MGVSSDRDEYDESFNNRLKSQRQKYERKNKRIIKSIVELNRKRNEQILLDMQNQVDKKKRDFIIKYRGLAGYNVNPFKMSSSELDFWEKKIYKKVEQRSIESSQNLDQYFDRLNSQFQYSNL